MPLAEILRHQRGLDYSDRYQELFTLSAAISTRDRDGVHKTFSGLMKLLFPAGNASTAEVEELLLLACEGRKRVKDQLLRIDTTYPETDFSFTARDGRRVAASTLEEREYPAFYHRRSDTAAPDEQTNGGPTATTASEPAPAHVLATMGPTEGHRVFTENQKGVTFAELFWPWLAGAARITLTDPYIRMFHQVRNLMELVELIAVRKAPEDEITLHLVTCPDDHDPDKQARNLQSVEMAAAAAGVAFSYEINRTGLLHARHLVTDSGWKISLDRGLDVFQKFEMNDAFSLANRQQAFRQVKSFEVTYLRIQL